MDKTNKHNNQEYPEEYYDKRFRTFIFNLISFIYENWGKKDGSFWAGVKYLGMDSVGKYIYDNWEKTDGVADNIMKWSVGKKTWRGVELKRKLHLKKVFFHEGSRGETYRTSQKYGFRPRELLTIGGVTKNEKDYRYQIPKPYFDIVMKIIEKHKNQNQKHWRKRTEAGPEANLLEIYKENSKRYTQNIKDEIDNMKTLKGDVTNKYFDLYPDSWKNKETVVTGFLNRLILAQITIDLLELRNIIYLDDMTDNERKQRWGDARDSIQRDKNAYDTWIEKRNISSYERSGGARKTRRKRKYIQKRKTKHKSRSKNKGKKTIKLRHRHRHRQTRKRYR